MEGCWAFQSYSQLREKRLTRDEPEQTRGCSREIFKVRGDGGFCGAKANSKGNVVPSREGEASL